MLYNTNLLGLVGGLYSSDDKLVIWDDKEKKIFREVELPFGIRQLKLKKDRIIVVFDQKICVLFYFDFKITEIFGFSEIIKLIALDKSLPAKGCLLAAISIIVIPRLQISTSSLYGFVIRISGAIHFGVPLISF